MNRQSVIRKFIEKCGTPITGKNSLFIYGSAYSKGHIGLTTKFNDTVKSLLKKYNEDHNHEPFHPLIETTAGHVLPHIHMVVNDDFYDFDSNDLLDCLRMLENKPFQKIHIFRWMDEPLPMLFNRLDCNISVVLAPVMGKISKIDPDAEKAVKNRFSNPWITGKPKANWIRQINPKSSYWIVEFPTGKDTFVADVWGYPIGRVIKCKKCGAEIDDQSWIKKFKMNHVECPCECDTYEDFCGCRRNREYNQIMKIRRQTQVIRHFMRKEWS